MDTPINPDIETDPKELKKRISFEEWKIRLHKRKLQELKLQQKKNNTRKTGSSYKYLY